MRLLVLFLPLVVLVFCPGDGEALEAEIFFESSHYRNAFYAVGDTISVIVVGYPELELPDSAEVTLVSALGDSETVRLEAAGGYFRASWTQEDEGDWWEKSLRGRIGSVESNAVRIANGILEVDPQSDHIIASYISPSGGDAISDTISIERIRTEVLNDGQYEYWKGKWYVYDVGYWYEVTDWIIVKFKPGATQASIESLNAEFGIIETSTNRLGFYDLKLPEGSDPIEMARQYLESGVVESAEVGTIGVYHETAIVPTTWGKLKARIGSSTPLRTED